MHGDLGVNSARPKSVAVSGGVTGVFSKIGNCFSKVWQSIVKCVKALFSCFNSSSSPVNPALRGKTRQCLLTVREQRAGFTDFNCLCPNCKVPETQQNASSNSTSRHSNPVTSALTAGIEQRQGGEWRGGEWWIAGYSRDYYRTIDENEVLIKLDQNITGSGSKSSSAPQSPLQQMMTFYVNTIIGKNKIDLEESEYSSQILTHLNPKDKCRYYYLDKSNGRKPEYRQKEDISNLGQVCRYPNVSPYINNLATKNPNFWVNASQIANNMIAIQGPFIFDKSGDKNYMGDIFKLALEKNSSCIVCVANVGISEGYIGQYWPSDRSAVLLPTSKLEEKSIVQDGEVQVEKTGEIKLSLSLQKLAGIFVRKLKISSNNQTKIIHQIHAERWPDKKVIEKEEFILLAHAIIFLNKRLNNKDKNEEAISDESPLITHCSAGVGRTGMVFVVLEMFAKFYKGEMLLAQDKEEQYRECVEWICNTIRTFREQRADMVQNYEQFNALVQVMEEIFINKKMGDYLGSLKSLEDQINGLTLEQ